MKSYRIVRFVQKKNLLIIRSVELELEVELELDESCTEGISASIGPSESLVSPNI